MMHVPEKSRCSPPLILTTIILHLQASDTVAGLHFPVSPSHFVDTNLSLIGQVYLTTEPAEPSVDDTLIKEDEALGGDPQASNKLRILNVN